MDDGGDAVVYAATTDGDETTTELQLTTTTETQQTSAADGDSSTVTDDDTTVTDLLTQTGKFYTGHGQNVTVFFLPHDAVSLRHTRVLYPNANDIDKLLAVLIGRRTLIPYPAPDCLLDV